MKFAKLFDIEEYQLLYTKEIDNDDEEYGVKIRLDLEGMSIATTLGFNDEEAVHKCYDAIDQHSAETTYKNVFYPLIAQYSND